MTTVTMPREADARLKAMLDARVFGGEGSWTSIGGGTVNSTWTVRHPHQADAIVRAGPSRETVSRGPSWLRGDALACEAIALDRVRPTVPQTPVTRAASFRPGRRQWIIQSVMPGHTFADVMDAIDLRDRLAIWSEIGSMVRHIHGVEGPWFGTPDGRQCHATWRDMMHADVTGLLDDAQRFGIDEEPFRHLLLEIESNADTLLDVGVPALVHSDLDPRHVFVEQDSEGWVISGVIDWEYARYADPMSDSLLVSMLARPEGDPDRVALLAGYGFSEAQLADPAFWQRQHIYREIVAGWELTDTARLDSVGVVEATRSKVE